MRRASGEHDRERQPRMLEGALCDRDGKDVFAEAEDPVTERERDPDPRRRAPLLGEHTEAVLKEYRFSADEIGASLRVAGAVA
jgi:crotonobetainyl-CoA:carnitine CoA-transferase CaiB-like acyl-CoA transferase